MMQMIKQTQVVLTRTVNANVPVLTVLVAQRSG
jgi:hypothetical protein